MKYNTNDSTDLVSNIYRLHTTELGLKRVQRNLNLEGPTIVKWCKDKILRKEAIVDCKTNR